MRKILIGVALAGGVAVAGPALAQTAPATTGAAAPATAAAAATQAASALTALEARYSTMTGPLGCDPGEVVIKFAHVVAERGHPKGEAAAALAGRVNKDLNGKACMQVYPNSVLYDDDKVLEAMLRGEVQMAAPSLSKFEPYTKAFRIFDLPFMFQDERAVEWFENSGPGQRLRNSMVDRGIQGLAYWNNGMKQFSAKKPLLLPSDLKGLRIRIQPSEVIDAQMAAVGAVGVPMAFKDVYDALKDGKVDGQENTWSNNFTKKFYEHQDGFTVTNHGVISYLVVTSTKFWNGLPDEVRYPLIGILAQVTAERNQLAKELDKDALRAMQALKVPIRTLTPEQRAEWVKAMQPVWKKFEAEIGVDAIRAAVSANN